jgi:hypothetical protein
MDYRGGRVRCGVDTFADVVRVRRATERPTPGWFAGLPAF